MDAERWIGPSCCVRDMPCLLHDDDTVQMGRVKQHEMDFKFHLSLTFLHYLIWEISNIIDECDGFQP